MSDKREVVIDGIAFRCDDLGTWERQTTGGVWAVVVNYWTEWLLDHVETMQDRLAEAEKRIEMLGDVSQDAIVTKWARAYFVKENKWMTFTENQYGFTWGPVEVARVTSDDPKGWVVIDVKSAKQTLQVYVTKTGKMRVYSFGKEIILPKTDKSDG